MDLIISPTDIERVKCNLETKKAIPGLTTFSSEDLYRSQIILNDLYTIGDTHITETSSISLLTLLDECSSSFNLFELMEHNRLPKIVYQLIKNIKLKQSNELDTLLIESNATKTESGWIRIPDTIYLPSKLDETSPIHLAHEMTHILKEFNPKEFISINTIQDVLPLTIELINAIEHDDLKVKYAIINKLQKDYYKMILKTLELKAYLKDAKNENTLLLIKEMLNINYQYFNSIYYAIALLDLYIEDPLKVVTYINQVLNNKMCTSEILKKLFSSKKEEESHYLDGISEYNAFILKS